MNRMKDRLNESPETWTWELMKKAQCIVGHLEKLLGYESRVALLVEFPVDLPVIILVELLVALLVGDLVGLLVPVPVGRLLQVGLPAGFLVVVQVALLAGILVVVLVGLLGEDRIVLGRAAIEQASG